MHIKYKNLKIVAIALTIVFAGVLPFVPASTQQAHADPVPTCGGGATLVRPPNPNNPPYCSCPKGQVLVTGPINTCKSSCPPGTVSGVDSLSGQAYCNQPKPKTCPDGSDAPGNDTSKCSVVCPGTTVSAPYTKAKPLGDVALCSDAASLGGNCSNGLTNCDLMVKYIYPLINLLAALVGLAVTISLVIGGIQYGSSAGDPQKVTAAKNRIRNAIIALVTFIFLYALLNFLVPGGLLK